MYCHQFPEMLRLRKVVFQGHMCSKWRWQFIQIMKVLISLIHSLPHTAPQPYLAQMRERPEVSGDFSEEVVFWILWGKRKNIYVFPSSWHRVLKPHNSPHDNNTRSIFCSNIWSLTSVSDIECLNPLEFPGWVRFCCIGWLLVGSWVGAGLWKTKPWLETWDFQLHITFSRERRGEMELMITQLC